MVRDRSVGAERTVSRTVDAPQTLEGAGFPVRRPFPGAGLQRADPFLLLDEMGPKAWGPGEAKGAPDHPHRGFETVTYMLAGRFEHRDSFGFSGELTPGDVQWMTAGSGVVHSELPEEGFRRTGGTVHGVQLWVNLPVAAKWTQPRYQDIPSNRIPEISEEWGKVRVLAGQLWGTPSPVETHIPILYLHLILAPGSEVSIPVAEDYHALTYLLDGSAPVRIGDANLHAGQLGVLGPGDRVTLEGPETGETWAQVLLMAGEPLNEPVARYGPFVMNSTAEIEQALRDFRDGRMGTIPRTE